MKVEKIYVYPVKALRAVELPECELTKHGFPHDRRFMLLHVDKDKDGNTQYKNIHVAHYPKSVLFHPSLDTAADLVKISYKPTEGEERALDFPLKPFTDDLEPVSVTMHKSPTTGLKMPQQYSDWFSTCYGFEVILVYLGPHYRKVLMSSTPNTRYQANSNTNGTSSWLSSITSTATSLLPSSLKGEESPQITFADCAPYLICSSVSMSNVQSRLTSNEKMDIIKFRPNIIISDAPAAWDEDFWGELTISSTTTSNNNTEGAVAVAKLECIHNCGRCTSINIDYNTGAPGETETGQILKKLQKDRRVDPGMKYSPIFGRYSFLSKGSEGVVIRKGDSVEVTKRNRERSNFDWEGLSTLGSS